VLEGVYRTTEGVPVFHAVRAHTAAELQALLRWIITRRGLHLPHGAHALSREIVL
jgi:hypothetical protein